MSDPSIRYEGMSRSVSAPQYAPVPAKRTRRPRCSWVFNLGIPVVAVVFGTLATIYNLRMDIAESRRILDGHAEHFGKIEAAQTVKQDETIRLLRVRLKESGIEQPDGATPPPDVTTATMPRTRPTE